MDWPLAGATLARALIVYVVVIAYVRVSGNRTLAKIRAFDLVMTIALGTLVGSTIVDASTPLWQGLLAMGALILLQWILSRLSVASRTVDRLVTNESIRLYADGEHDAAAMRRARVTREEVNGAARAAGLTDIAQAKEVWLEVNGDMSVVTRQ